MGTNETNPSYISEELFDEFRSSKWPELFGGTAYHSRTNDTPFRGGLEGIEACIAISPMEVRNMLEEVGAIRQDPQSEHPDYCNFWFHRVGRQLVRVCEGLYTPEEYEQSEEEARAFLEAAKLEWESERAL